MTIDEMIAVLQAAKEGKPIEWRPIRDVSNPVWALLDNHVDPVFNFFGYEYRVKPQPREWWLVRSGMCDCGSPEVHGFHAYTDKDRGGEKGAIHVREVLDE